MTENMEKRSQVYTGKKKKAVQNVTRIKICKKILKTRKSVQMLVFSTVAHALHFPILLRILAFMKEEKRLTVMPSICLRSSTCVKSP